MASEPASIEQRLTDAEELIGALQGELATVRERLANLEGGEDAYEGEYPSAEQREARDAAAAAKREEDERRFAEWREKPHPYTGERWGRCYYCGGPEPAAIHPLQGQVVEAGIAGAPTVRRGPDAREEGGSG